MSISINEFKVNCLTMYNNRAVDEKLFSEVQQLTVTQRVKAFALEIFAILALVFSVDKEDWSRVVKELHAQVWTGAAYIPLTPSRAAQSDAQKTSLLPKDSQQANDEKSRKITKVASSSSSSSAVSSSSSTEFTTSTSSTHPSLSRQAMRKIRQEASDIYDQIDELCGRGFGFRDDAEQLMSLSSQTHQEILIWLLRLVTLLSFEIEYKKSLTDQPESIQNFHINIHLAYFERFKVLTWIVDKDEFLNRELVEPRLQRRINFIIENPYQSKKTFAQFMA